MSSFLKGEMGAKETAGRVSCGSKASAFRPVREVRHEQMTTRGSTDEGRRCALGQEWWR